MRVRDSEDERVVKVTLAPKETKLYQRLRSS